MHFNFFAPTVDAHCYFFSRLNSLATNSLDCEGRPDLAPIVDTRCRRQPVDGRGSWHGLSSAPLFHKRIDDCAMIALGWKTCASTGSVILAHQVAENKVLCTGGARRRRRRQAARG
jgi:hypothetical protein